VAFNVIVHNLFKKEMQFADIQPYRTYAQTVISQEVRMTGEV